MAKIMIVDDDKTMVTLMQTLLGLDGYDAVIAPRGIDALERANGEIPDLFMIDFNLNDMTGVQLVEKLRADPRFEKTPIVMASGYNVEDEALKAGATVFIVKPFEPGRLTTLFKKLLAR